MCSRTYTQTQREGTHSDSITNTKNFYRTWQQSNFLWSGDLWLHFLFPPRYQTSRKPTLSWQQHRAKVFSMFFCGYKLVVSQRVCTSLAAQGKVNSSGGHSLICQGWNVEEGPSGLPVTSHNLWYQRQLEREGVKTGQPCCSLASYLSLPITSSFRYNLCNSIEPCKSVPGWFHCILALLDMDSLDYIFRGEINKEMKLQHTFMSVPFFFFLATLPSIKVSQRHVSLNNGPVLFFEMLHVIKF